MEIEKKKDPNDYPLLSFRLKHNEKEQINERLEEVVELCNLSRAEDEKMYRKNTVLVAAIIRGLETIEKEFSRKTKSKRK